MSSCLPLILLFGSLFMPVAQGDFDSMLQLLIERYGGKTLTKSNTEATGNILYFNKETVSFTLTAKKRQLRMEMRGGNSTVTYIQRDGRTQACRGGKTDFPDQVLRALSSINLLPIFALLDFQDDPRFRGSLVQDKIGSWGLKFTEETPQGFKPPPFPQPMISVTFWLDAGGRIARAAYDEGRERAPVISYQYFYDSKIAGSFLQAGSVACSVDARLLWTATLSGTQDDVTVAADFFKILETHERVGVKP